MLADNKDAHAKQDHGMPVVLLAPDTHMDHGLGHFSRMMNLASAMGQIGARSVVVVERDDLRRWLVDNRVEMRHLVSSSFADYVKGLASLSQHYKADAIVVDDYRFTAFEMRLLMERGVILICIDDNADREIDCNLLINPNPFADCEKYRAVAARHDACLLGQRYDMRRVPSHRTPMRTVRQCPNGMNVLVTMGGAAPSKLSHRISRIVAACAMVHEVKVVLPSEAPEPKPFMCETVPIEVLPLQDSLDPLIEWSDIVICSCSTTVYEVVNMQRPLLAIAHIDNQAELLRYLNGIGIPACDCTDDLEGIIARTIKQLTNDDGRMSQMDIQSQMGCVYGAAEVAHEIVRYVLARHGFG